MMIAFLAGWRELLYYVVVNALSCVWMAVDRSLRRFNKAAATTMLTATKEAAMTKGMRRGLSVTVVIVAVE